MTENRSKLTVKVDENPGENHATIAESWLRRFRMEGGARKHQIKSSQKEQKTCKEARAVLEVKKQRMSESLGVTHDGNQMACALDDCEPDGSRSSKRLASGCVMCSVACAERCPMWDALVWAPQPKNLNTIIQVKAYRQDFHACYRTQDPGTDF